MENLTQEEVQEESNVNQLAEKVDDKFKESTAEVQIYKPLQFLYHSNICVIVWCLPFIPFEIQWQNSHCVQTHCFMHMLTGHSMSIKNLCSIVIVIMSFTVWGRHFFSSCQSQKFVLTNPPTFLNGNSSKLCILVYYTWRNTYHYKSLIRPFIIFHQKFVCELLLPLKWDSSNFWVLANYHIHIFKITIDCSLWKRSYINFSFAGIV